SFCDTLGFVHAGALLGTIHSSRLEEQLVALRTELSVQMANLEVVATGEKEALLRQLREEINLAREGLRLQTQQYERAKLLFADGIIALAEMEEAEHAFEEATSRVGVAESALDVAATGEKEASVSLVASRIHALREQIDFLEQKQARLAIKAPFAGWVHTESTLAGDRLILADTAASVLIIPVPRSDASYICAGQPISLQLADRAEPLQGTVLTVDQQIALLNREAVVTVRAIVSEDGLPGGLPVACAIHCEPVRVSEFLNRSIQWP
ncbi:MAG: hypothetical protein KDC54_02535, partial [Lewinella sp.]|nr:hypothetical protein [Lewinella sp.]